MVGITDEDMKMDLIKIEVLEDNIHLKFQYSRILAKRLKVDFKNVHSALSNDVNRMVTFIDKKYMDIFEFQVDDFEGEAYSFEANILKLVFSDNNFIYCFTQNKKISRCIFSIIDLSGTIQTN